MVSRDFTVGSSTWSRYSACHLRRAVGRVSKHVGAASEAAYPSYSANLRLLDECPLQTKFQC
jgi:hypothetical protein